jgi:DNA-binding transcriptional LysR family regulator
MARSVNPRLLCQDAQVSLAAALSGAGIAQLPEPLRARDLRRPVGAHPAGVGILGGNHPSGLSVAPRTAAVRPRISRFHGRRWRSPLSHT